MRAYRPRHAPCGHPHSRILTIFQRATEKATCPPVPQGFGGLFYFAVASVAAALKARRLAEKRPTANHPTRPQKRAIINNPGAKREVAETIARRTVSKIPKPTAHIIARRKERANMPESSPPTPPKPRDMPKNMAKPFISFLLSSVSAQILPQAQPHRALQRSSQSHRSRQKRSTQTHPKYADDARASTKKGTAYCADDNSNDPISHGTPASCHDRLANTRRNNGRFGRKTQPHHSRMREPFRRFGPIFQLNQPLRQQAK